MSTQVELERRREELAGRVAGLHWDLGGLAYEMAILVKRVGPHLAVDPRPVPAEDAAG